VLFAEAEGLLDCAWSQVNLTKHLM